MNHIIRETLFNRLFHCRQVREQRKLYEEGRRLRDAAPSIVKALQEGDTLEKLLSLHKTLWGSGFRNYNLGPCADGMFRTKDILGMTVDEVYLGNIYGLWTFNIREWEKHKGEPVGANGFGLDEKYSLYQIILNQYKNVLLSNVRAIAGKAADYVETYEAVNN